MIVPTPSLNVDYARRCPRWGRDRAESTAGSPWPSELGPVPALQRFNHPECRGGVGRGDPLGKAAVLLTEGFSVLWERRERND